MVSVPDNGIGKRAQALVCPGNLLRRGQRNGQDLFELCGSICQLFCRPSNPANVGKCRLGLCCIGQIIPGPSVISPHLWWCHRSLFSGKDLRQTVRGTSTRP